MPLKAKMYIDGEWVGALDEATYDDGNPKEHNNRRCRLAGSKTAAGDGSAGRPRWKSSRS